MLVGLWTPIAGTVVALFEVWITVAGPAGWQASVLAAGIATAIALLGPGSWSVDARIYGRKRISINIAR